MERNKNIEKGKKNDSQKCSMFKNILISQLTDSF